MSRSKSLGLAGSARGWHCAAGSGTIVPSFNVAAPSHWSQLVGTPTLMRVEESSPGMAPPRSAPK